MVFILIHGLGQDDSSWEKTIDYFSEDTSIRCVDLFSLLRTKETNYNNLYHAFVKYCADIDEPVHLCGLSLGGVLALNYTIDYPQKIKSVILIGTQFKMPKILLSIQHMIFRLMPKSFFEDTGLDKTSFTVLSNSLTHLNFSNQLSDIQTRVMIICGEKDFVNKKASRRLHQYIEGSQLEMIENAGHEVNLDNPEKLGKILTDFWDTIQ